MRHLHIALSQYGIKEVPGEQDNPEILKYFKDMGHDGARLKDETAWCSAFVNWVMKTAGMPYTGRLNARSWLSLGASTQCPKLGDVVVFWRDSPESWKGHVGFYINAISPGWISVLGGNQNNKVCIKNYPKSRLLGYRRV